MTYDWEADANWKDYYDKNHSRAADEKGKKKDAESLKRAFYGTKVNKEFEKNFEFENEGLRNEYF
jgi:hypothetical protein